MRYLLKFICAISYETKYKAKNKNQSKLQNLLKILLLVCVKTLCIKKKFNSGYFLKS